MTNNNKPSLLKNTLNKLRKTSLPLAQNASLAVAVGTITGNSVLFSLPLWAMGAVKTLTGHPLADKSVL